MTNNKNKIFLIVDDEPDMCWTLKHILSNNGFVSDLATSGGEAMDMIQKTKYCLVLLDAKLPDIEGLELARQIHSHNPVLPIVMISGYFYNEDAAVQKALAEGVICAFISKPFVNQDIIRIISQLPSLSSIQ